MMVHAHLWPDTAALDETGRLFLAGLSLAALAQEYGTPLYVFDEATIRAQCRAFHNAFVSRWPQSTIAYASKAYLSPALCQILLEEGLDLDVVSMGEWSLAQRAGFPLERMHLHGNFKPRAELAAALEVGLGRIVVDSLEEAERWIEGGVRIIAYSSDVAVLHQTYASAVQRLHTAVRATA